MDDYFSRHIFSAKTKNKFFSSPSFSFMCTLIQLPPTSGSSKNRKSISGIIWMTSEEATFLEARESCCQGRASMGRVCGLREVQPLPEPQPSRTETGEIPQLPFPPTLQSPANSPPTPFPPMNPPDGEEVLWGRAGTSFPGQIRAGKREGWNLGDTENN